MGEEDEKIVMLPERHLYAPGHTARMRRGISPRMRLGILTVWACAYRKPL